MPTEVVSEPGTVPRLQVRGELDGSVTDQLLDAYAATVSSGGGEVLLDLGEVGYLDSSGLAAVVQLLSRVRADGGRLRVRGLSEHYREIFAITRLDEHVTIEAGQPVDPARESP